MTATPEAGPKRDFHRRPQTDATEGGGRVPATSLGPFYFFWLRAWLPYAKGLTGVMPSMAAKSVTFSVRIPGMVSRIISAASWRSKYPCRVTLPATHKSRARKAAPSVNGSTVRPRKRASDWILSRASSGLSRGLIFWSGKMGIYLGEILHRDEQRHLGPFPQREHLPRLLVAPVGGERGEKFVKQAHGILRTRTTNGRRLVGSSARRFLSTDARARVPPLVAGNK